MIERLLENNRRWAERWSRTDPGFLPSLALEQRPEYLWVGCADSRVPANEVVDVAPGQLFVHRNVANLTPPSDLNFLAVLSFAVKALGVKHIIVCGHHGCGGIKAAIKDERHGIVDHWLAPVRATYRHHRAEIEALTGDDARIDRLAELNVADRVQDVANTMIVRDTWKKGQELAIHGWIYRLADGLIRDLRVTARRPEDVD